MNPILITVSGPTAVGKTSFAIDLAEKLNTEIISFDSRQFYKEMTIGTAVPSNNELNKIKHHFIQHKSIHDNYTINDFLIDFDELVKKYFNEKKYIVLVGGSNLYLKSIVYGLDNIPTVPDEIRAKLNIEYQNKGIVYMQNKLKKLDPQYYKNVDLQNHRRIIRALEVSVFTRKPFSSFLSGNETEKYKNHSIALNLDRNILYEKINSRVNKMLDNGLIDEVKELLPHEHLNSLNTIGYKEIFKHFNGELNFQETIELIKTNSRRFAKRQLSWLKNNGNHYWLESTESNKNNIEKLFQQIF